MTAQIETLIDVATRTTRGRTCPRCGGKIIPSIRSVYQSPGDPNGVFAAWQCERCSYEEVLSRPAAAPARELPAKAVATASAKATPTAAPVVSLPQAEPPMQDVQGRDLPADVRLMISQMNKAQSRLPSN